MPRFSHVYSIFIVVAVPVIVGCGDSDSTSTEPTDETRQYLDEMEGYDAWTPLNEEAKHSQSHGGRYIVTYQNQTAEDARGDVEAGESTFPEGSLFVKELHPEPGGEVVGFDAMAKLSDEEGDWYWIQATADRSEIRDGNQGDVDTCTACHGGPDAYDYVFLDAY